MQSLKLWTCLAAVSATLLTGCSAGDGSLILPMDGGDTVFSGTVSSPDPYCDEFHASADLLLSDVWNIGERYDGDSPGGCLAGFVLIEGIERSSIEFTLRVEPADAPLWLTSSISATYPIWMDRAADNIEQLGLTEDEYLEPQWFSAQGWTYGYDALTGGRLVEHGEIVLVLTTRKSILECRYSAASRNPQSAEAVAATCNEFRELLYQE